MEENYGPWCVDQGSTAEECCGTAGSELRQGIHGRDSSQPSELGTKPKTVVAGIDGLEYSPSYELQKLLALMAWSIAPVMNYRN